ncbi:hypothetical protein [Albimonas pacifica]|uniref:Uncharacterized protein n=1 Tax=Albimonas pacifica TaxID=1114924 RepID=A0A1I3EPL0_9RHOB|nr:hypothetical protein [Albimonas pacifica]SFI00872.1 hypothetical protein SAMN05216258_103512 [Albimonas pacifica]
MTNTSDDAARGGDGFAPRSEERAEAMQAMRAGPATPGPQHKADPSAVGGPLTGGGAAAAPDAGGVVEREAAAAVAALHALARVAHFGRGRPELVHRLSEALGQVDEALAEAVRELYGTSDESDED